MSLYIVDETRMAIHLTVPYNTKRPASSPALLIFTLAPFRLSNAFISRHLPVHDEPTRDIFFVPRMDPNAGGDDAAQAGFTVTPRDACVPFITSHSQYRVDNRIPMLRFVQTSSNDGDIALVILGFWH